ncbi:hypothetical protein BOTBODRAFT_178721 [Botryobasidium botryosum FD-172 SS1]|uniref:Uncharacterized protein n=1 Tax=Botryobasidium botryosum (strain FD-172 SS1) TaxID=930990 RepID=A0A067ME21_BOTB1|nr:hypothetical protein BOTBODRAFT_178721 [Botryobasidium botryosum FD-172 SS1]
MPQQSSPAIPTSGTTPLISTSSPFVQSEDSIPPPTQRCQRRVDEANPSLIITTKGICTVLARAQDGEQKKAPWKPSRAAAKHSKLEITMDNLLHGT